MHLQFFFRFALHAMSLQFTDPKSCRIFRKDESVRTIHLLLRSRESLKEWRVVFQAAAAWQGDGWYITIQSALNLTVTVV